MKFVKILSLILAVLMLSAMFIGCDNKKETASAIPEDEYNKSWDENTVTVSFRIQYDETKKDSEGNSYTTPKVLVEAVDYEYKSHNKPTIMNIITNYMSVHTNYTYRFDGKIDWANNEDNRLLKKIGKYPNTKDQKGMYWAFAAGIDDTKLCSELDIIDSSMSKYNVIENECLEFTVFLTDTKQVNVGQ